MSDRCLRETCVFSFLFFLTIKMTPSLSSAKISLSIALFGHQGNSNMGFAATKGKYLLGEKSHPVEVEFETCTRYYDPPYVSNS